MKSHLSDWSTVQRTGHWNQQMTFPHLYYTNSETIMQEIYLSCWKIAGNCDISFEEVLP